MVYLGRRFIGWACALSDQKEAMSDGSSPTNDASLQEKRCLFDASWAGQVGGIKEASFLQGGITFDPKNDASWRFVLTVPNVAWPVRST